MKLSRRFRLDMRKMFFIQWWMGCPVQSQEVDSVILMDPIQLSIFYDSQESTRRQLMTNNCVSHRRLSKRVSVVSWRFPWKTSWAAERGSPAWHTLPPQEDSALGSTSGGTALNRLSQEMRRAAIKEGCSHTLWTSQLLLALDKSFAVHMLISSASPRRLVG